MVKRKHIGQGFEDFLQEQGIYEEVQLNALKKDPCASNQKHDE